jgi:hypothetical protein
MLSLIEFLLSMFHNLFECDPWRFSNKKGLCVFLKRFRRWLDHFSGPCSYGGQRLWGHLRGPNSRLRYQFSDSLFGRVAHTIFGEIVGHDSNQHLLAVEETHLGFQMSFESVDDLAGIEYLFVKSEQCAF